MSDVGTLHDELAEVRKQLAPLIHSVWCHCPEVSGHGPGYYLPTDLEDADALLPVVRRWAADQVAAERERIAAAIEAEIGPLWHPRDRRAFEVAARIARGQP
jgi:hypothetical protein